MTLSVNEIIYCLIIRYFMDNELERMWSRATVPSFKVIFRHLPGKPPGFSIIDSRFETGTSGIRSRVVTHLITAWNFRNCAPESATNQLNPYIINKNTHYFTCITLQIFYAIINTIRKNWLLYFWGCEWYWPGSLVILIRWRLSKCVCWESWTIKELGGLGRIWKGREKAASVAASKNNVDHFREFNHSVPSQYDTVTSGSKIYVSRWAWTASLPHIPKLPLSAVCKRYKQ